MRSILCVICVLLGSACRSAAGPEPAVPRDGRTIVVAADGSGDYRTIQAALDAAAGPDSVPTTVFIRKGLYQEKLFITRSYVTLVGENRDSTRIVYPQLRRQWTAAHRGSDWGAGTVNIDTAAHDVTLANLTIFNNYGSLYGDHDHQFALRGFGTRVILLGCNVIADGGDTVSLWDRDDGMYYHAYCYFEGWVDYVCPRGWCFIRDSRFFGHNRPSASLWHDGSRDRKQKFVVTDSFLDGVSQFPLGRNHLDAQIYLVRCTFSANMADRPFYRPPSSPRPWQWGDRHYFYDCHRLGGDFPWFADNLQQSEAGARAGDITSGWTFDGRWDPERAMPSLLPYAILPFPADKAGEVDPSRPLTLRWVPARNAAEQLLSIGKGDSLRCLGPVRGRELPAGALEPHTTYHWRLDTVTGADTLRGLVWEFTTREGVRRTVLLDNFYNNEWRKDSLGRPVRYHYLWHDTASSGFSQLGGIITRTGAVVDTLCQAPTGKTLERASVYMIVDPDTPRETAAPEYISDEASAAIEAWVRQGGILVLMGNDKGNAEFEHLNRLAGRFGIRFNEDSRNRVTGTAYETGTFDRFPDHPLFKGVRRIFIKELSTLSLHDPAAPVFTQQGDVIMAFAPCGKGGVFAVGDPWFYNEYMDQRRLPAGYDNPRAADNLFRWLLSLSRDLSAKPASP